MILISGFGILMGGLMMEAKLMIATAFLFFILFIFMVLMILISEF